MKKSSYDYELIHKEANMKTETRYFPTNLCWQEFVSEDVQHMFKSIAKRRFCHLLRTIRWHWGYFWPHFMLIYPVLYHRKVHVR
jgi:hypothetical protein